MTDRLVICIDKLNNKLKDLLEENKRLKQQHENLQEENRETLRINSKQKEMLQERDKQFEKLVINLEKQKLEGKKRFKQLHNKLLEENKEFSRNNSELKAKLQENDEQLKKFQQEVLSYEKQKVEIEVISQNLEKSLELLELDDEVNENEI
ncbi:2865_t:CDS:1 [Funneliformis geosporum]|uniref:1260_t:CDS:1 n=1 Tax=Funneliformis geosporum TaxID=1117311 RepID=A0A9W4SKV4_9GLOM|nr:2865_t:CDS:1 [Funneliformis geosporum]CAI2172133.1 1260_t:CDS:1 [Funneliformis geosporum]